MSSSLSIMWFRRDFRLSDNPALYEAARQGKVLAVYIDHDPNPAPFATGAASRLYSHHALHALEASLGSRLNVYKGNPVAILPRLARQYHATHLYWNRSYEPWQGAQDAAVTEAVAAVNVQSVPCDGSYLWDPFTVTKEDGSYYKVFSAYKRKAYECTVRASLPVPQGVEWVKDKQNQTSIDSVAPPSQHPWETRVMDHWSVGEEAAHRALSQFIEQHLSGYKKGRDSPSAPHYSRLSAHLHFGEISPYSVWEKVNRIGPLYAPEEDIAHYLSEIVWREFSCYLMAHVPTLPMDNFQAAFDRFPWRDEPTFYEAWKRGNTGYPLVDAGMRELWETGYMHNRVRMIVASFLVKNLSIHWHYGRDWFWECLVDADLANNSASWQWVAGCGADAAPYFRIFNPLLQGETHDPEGRYVRRFLPVLAQLPNRYIHCPWKAPDRVLQTAGVRLGDNYPRPIVDLQTSRQAALQAYRSL